jgi:hypothetical protein
MSPWLKMAFASSCLVLMAGGVARADSAWLKGSTDEKLNKLADIQPGVGTVMIEYSYRFGALYFAANGGNWKLADYQLKEMTEIQEVGETTRPARAKALKAFEDSYLTPLGDAIKAKDVKKFNAAFQVSLKACNDCHVDQAFPFIKYELPKASPSPLSSKP